jgi:hypothetical protein
VGVDQRSVNVEENEANHECGVERTGVARTGGASPIADGGLQGAVLGA